MPVRGMPGEAKVRTIVWAATAAALIAGSAAAQAPDPGKRRPDEGPHGPPRVLQAPTSVTMSTLESDIRQAKASGDISKSLRKCKLGHLRRYREAEARRR